MVVAVIGLSLTVVMCRSCGGKKKAAVQEQKAKAEQVVQQAKRTDALKIELQSFLKDYAPSLAVKREETIRAIEDARETRGKFSAKIDKYPTEDTKAIFRNKVARYDQMIRKLSQLLATIDQDAMIALAEREARSIEGGGIEGMDSEALINSAESILKQAALLKSDSESVSGPGGAPKPGAGASPSDPSSTTEGSGSLQIPPPADQPPAPESKFDKLLRQADDLAKRVKTATDSIRTPEPEPADEPAPASKPAPKITPLSPPKTKPTPKPAPPPIDRAAIEGEIRRLDASIATHEANLNRAWARVNEISKNHTVPVVRGSRQHQEIQAIERAIQLSESQLPGLKDRRELLRGQLQLP